MPQAIREIFKTNLRVKKTERVLVFTDKPAKSEVMDKAESQRRESLRNVAHMVEQTGRGFCRELIFHEFTATGTHGKEPPRKIWSLAFGDKAVEALNEAGLMTSLMRKNIKSDGLVRAQKIINKHKKDAVDVIIALSNYSTSHTSFRSLLSDICGVRYASMPLFDVEMLSGPMDVDIKSMSKRTKAVASLLSKNQSVRITTAEGTDLTFSIKGRKGEPDTGLITKEGDFGNLPAGEAYLAPVEGTANGKMVLIWAPIRKLNSPVTVTVKDGLAIMVEGKEDFVKYLEGRFNERKENRNIAELGIGTNERATRPDNILESEKILGTIHIAFGDNSSFGGTVKTPFHQDFVFFNPTVELTNAKGEKTMLHKAGKLMVD